MKAKKQSQKLLGAQSKFFRVQLAVLVVAAVAIGTYLVARIYAASGSLFFTPSVATINIGDTFTVEVRENSGSDAINVVEANVAYDATKLQYLSTSETGSGFGIAAITTPGVGTLNIVRAVSGGVAPVTGEKLVTTLSFKALAAGVVNLTFLDTSALVQSSDFSNVLSIRTPAAFTLSDIVGPTVPTGISAPTRNLSSLSLAWNVSSDNVGVTGYQILRDNTVIGNATTAAYTDAGLTPGRTYSYKIVALDKAGNASAGSQAFAVGTLADTTAPITPGKPVSATQTMTSVSLSWAASTDNVAVTAYRVLRGATQVAVVPGVSYTDSDLTMSTSYTYTVTAIDAAGNVSAPSAATVVRTLADTQAPSTPQALSWSATGRNLRLSWTAASDNVGITIYNIYRDDALLTTSVSSSTTIANATLGSHAYSVTAVDAAGNISTPSTQVATQVYLPADIDRDTRVKGSDLSAILTNWNATGVNRADINGSGRVDIYDLAEVLGNWTG